MWQSTGKREVEGDDREADRDMEPVMPALNPAPWPHVTCGTCVGACVRLV